MSHGLIYALQVALRLILFLSVFGSFLYFYFRKRIYWVLLIFGSLIVAIFTETMSYATATPAFDLITATIFIYTALITAYVFAHKVKTDEELKNERPRGEN